jgi:hypothetical protein
METISSRQTFFLKWIFPLLWIGILSAVVVPALLKNNISQGWFVIIVMLFMLAGGVAVFRFFVWSLADEVELGADSLLIRRGGVEDRVRLSDIMNVDISRFSNPQRITLWLRMPGKFGNEIAFVPKMSGFQLNPFSRNKIMERLVENIDRARRAGR